MADVDNSQMSGIAEICKCPYCKDLYDDPRNLPDCPHALCAGCIYQLKGDGNSVQCPECHKTSYFRDVEELHENIFLTRAVELIRKEEKAKKLCSDYTVDKCNHLIWMDNASTCEHCKQKFCGSCYFRHLEHVRMELVLAGRRFGTRMKKGVEELSKNEAAVKAAVELKAVAARETIAKSTSLLEKSLVSGVSAIRKRLLNQIHEIGNGQLAKIRSLASDSDRTATDQQFVGVTDLSLLDYSAQRMGKLYRAAVDRDQEISDVENLKFVPEFGKIKFNSNSAKEHNIIDDLCDREKSKVIWKYHGPFVESAEDKKNYGHLPSDLKRLHVSSKKGDLAAIKELLAGLTGHTLRFAVEHVDLADGNKTPFLQAVENSHLDIVKYLVAEKHANLYAKVKLNNDDSIADNDDEEDETSDERDNGFSLAIHLAIQIGQLEIVKFLIDFDPEMLEAQDGAGNTPLCRAVFADQLEIVKYLAGEKKANLEHRNSVTEWTPLMLAVNKGLGEVAKCLIENGASLLASCKFDSELSPFYLAIAEGHLEIVRYLVDANPAFANTRFAWIKRTCLHLCCETDDVEILKFLLEKATEISVETQNQYGEDVLLYAAFQGASECVRYLLKTFPTLLDKRDCPSDREAILYVGNGNDEYQVRSRFQEAHRKAFQERQQNQPTALL